MAVEAIVLATGLCWAQNRQDSPTPDDVQKTVDSDGGRRKAIEQGKYIVHDVAMCVYCHTPKNESGDLEQVQLLEGAPMPVRSPFENRQWAAQAPSLAGLPGGWSEDDLVQLLTTGQRPRGPSPRPPMPPFRMRKADAQAVAAYLKSLE